MSVENDRSAPVVSTRFVVGTFLGEMFALNCVAYDLELLL